MIPDAVLLDEQVRRIFEKGVRNRLLTYESETYIQLTVVERAFRVLKSELLLRPS